MLDTAPSFDTAAAHRLALDHFGVDGLATPLPSERDQNFLITPRSGAALVLKIANARDDRPLLEAQQAALRHLAPRLAQVPKVVPAGDGSTLVEVEGPHGAHLAWAITWIDGVPLAEVGTRPSRFLEELGETIGALSVGLADFDHPAIHRNLYWDLAGGRARSQ